MQYDYQSYRGSGNEDEHVSIARKALRVAVVGVIVATAAFTHDLWLGPIGEMVGVRPTSGKTQEDSNRAQASVGGSYWIQGTGPYAEACVQAMNNGAQIAPCAVTDSMAWSINENGRVQSADGRCLTSIGTADGAAVELQACGDMQEQRWTHNAETGHLYNGNQRCLDIYGPSTQIGTAVQAWTCQNVPQHKWRLVSTG